MAGVVIASTVVGSSMTANTVTEAFSASDIDGWDVVIAVVVLIATWIVSRIAQRAVLRLATRVDGVSDELRATAARAVKYFIVVLGIGVALTALGASIQPLLAGAIIVGVALALALRGIADNFGAGVVIQTRHPIHVGDEIESNGYIGTVRELNLRSVLLETFDGRQVHLPNSSVLDNPLIVNNTLGARRSDLELRLASDRPPHDLVDAVRAAGAATDGMLPDRDLEIQLVAVEPARVTMLVRVWHTPSDGMTVVSSLMRSLSGALRDAGIEATMISPPPPPPFTPMATT
jgi:small-conductance mechanosensitive channel